MTVVTATRGPAFRQRLRPLAPPVAIYLACRAAYLAAAWVATAINPEENIRSALLHWDSAWNYDIAEHGYGTLPHLVFFPILPMAARWTGRLPGLNTFQGGLLVTFVAGLGAAVLLHRLVARRYGEAVASRALLLLVFSPFAFVLALLYTEGIALLAVAATFLALERRRWLLAGLAAAVVSGSRPNGVLIIVPCFVAAVVAIGTRRDWRSLIAPLLAPTTFVAWCAFVWHRTGSMTGYFDLQRDHWGQGTDFGWTTLTAVAHALRGDFGDTNRTMTAFVVVVAWIALVLAIRQRLPLTWLAYAGVLVLQVTVARVPAAGGRYLLLAFPLFVAGARALPERRFGEYLAASAAVAGSLFIVSILSLALTP